MPVGTLAVATRHARCAARERERDIVDATRALFDERGMQDAPIEEIARAVGINKALIYRHFASKDELFVLTMTRYLDELPALAAEIDADAPRARGSSDGARALHGASACATPPSWTARCR